MPKQVWTKEKVIADLKRFRKDGPRMNLKLDEAAKRYFGSVRAALKAAGLPCGKRPPPYHSWSKELVIDAICQRDREGKSLDSINRDDPSLYAAGKRLFGNWTAARKVAGFPSVEPDFYTADEVQLRMIELYERELPLTFGSHRDFKLQRSAKKHFGGWKKAAKSLGLDRETRRTWTDQAVIDGIHLRRASGKNLFTTHKEDKALFCAAVARFGNWHNALKAAGMDRPTRERWSEERIIERLQELAAASDVKSVSRADRNLRHAAWRRFGSLEKAIEIAGAMTLSKRWTKERVIQSIHSRFAEVGPIPIAGLGDHRLSNLAWKYFGSWDDAVKAAGLADRIPVRVPPKRLSRGVVIRIIQQGHAAGISLPNLAKQEPGLASSARKHFGQWRRAVEAAGLEPSHRIWSREMIIAEIEQRLSGGRSLRSGDRANIRVSAAAARHFGSWTAALQAAGVPTKPRKAR